MATLCENSKSFDLGFCGAVKHVLDAWAINDSLTGMCPAGPTFPWVLPSNRTNNEISLPPSPSAQSQLIEWIELTAKGIGTQPHTTLQHTTPQHNQHTLCRGREKAVGTASG